MVRYHSLTEILNWGNRMTNKFRLSSRVFEREEENEKIEPHKIFFLSVEGNVTEKEYLEGLSANRVKLGINAIVDVEVLGRRKRDTNSAPQQVVELLEEYLRLREYGEESLIEEIPKEFVDAYGTEFIQKFLENPDDVPRRQKNAFITDLMKIGYDINYRKYLNKYKNDIDEFGILIDRDMQTHSEINMSECIQYCKDKGYACYISNPCFEFWLLLHLSDVKEEYADKMELIKENPKISDNHTFVSKEVSLKARHGKGGINFKGNYLMHIDEAIIRAKEFVSSDSELIDNIGCNVWKLIERMRAYKK